MRMYAQAWCITASSCSRLHFTESLYASASPVLIDSHLFDAVNLIPLRNKCEILNNVIRLRRKSDILYLRTHSSDVSQIFVIKFIAILGIDIIVYYHIPFSLALGNWFTASEQQSLELVGGRMTSVWFLFLVVFFHREKQSDTG